MKQKRLEAILEILPVCDSYLDVGCDHGYLALMIRKKYPDATVCASDIAEGPLQMAGKTMEQAHVTDIPLYLSDGLRSVPVSCECVIIAGMGGQTITEILLSDKKYAENTKYFVLEPNVEVEMLRQWLGDNGFRILDETLVHDYKYYPILVCEHGNQTQDAYDVMFGPVLRRQPTAVFTEYWTNEKEKLLTYLSVMKPTDKSYVSYHKRLEMIENVLKNGEDC
ncbi:MAG: SAM-dependent methyltransferase [Erysipelotrichaceae bacterium]|nr:SAM-dependent methyltransferase [Erysipelotrichaceae bacterium]